VFLHEKLKSLQNKKHYKKAEVKNMSKLYVLSAFSLSMIPYRGWIHLFICDLKVEDARKIIDEAMIKNREIISAVGHPATAQLLSDLLGRKITANRIQVELNDGDEAIIAQITTRLPEGKVLSKEELQKLYDEGKIKLLYLQLSLKFW